MAEICEEMGAVPEEWILRFLSAFLFRLSS